MAKKQQHGDKPTDKGKVERLLVNNLRPQLLEGTHATYEKMKEKNQKANPCAWEGSKVKTFFIRRLPFYLAAMVKTFCKNIPTIRGVRTGAALGVYGGLNYLYGVRSWNTGAKLSAERMIHDAGPVARIVTAKVVSVAGFSAMAPEQMATMANTLLAVEIGVCAIRMVAEQIAWRKTRFSGEVAGTGATPLFAFALGELPVKALEKYPADPLKRFVIATRGIYGNLVRMVHAGLIIAFGNPIWNAITKKKQPFEGTPGRNPNTGLPEMPTDLSRSNGDLKNSNKS